MDMAAKNTGKSEDLGALEYSTMQSGRIPVELAGVLVKMLEDKNSTSKIYLSYRERRHISKIKMEQYEDVKYVRLDSDENTDFKAPFAERYIGATDITYSMLASIYDVNSSKLAVFNVFENPKNCINGFFDFVRKLKSPNLEARLIGMQNGSDIKTAELILEYLIKNRIALVEVDLFGNEKRHIAIDSKNGMSFNILVNNINYRPGELISKMTTDQFRRSLIQASEKK